MKLIASSDGVICTMVSPNRRAVLRSGNPASNAAMTPATKMTVPGMPTKFRLTVASSGVGIGATGGIRSTALCRNGIGMRNASKFRYRADRGQAGDEDQDGCDDERRPALQHLDRCMTSALMSPASPLTGITSAGFQNFRNATVTSSEKIADTMSTSPMS